MRRPPFVSGKNGSRVQTAEEILSEKYGLVFGQQPLPIASSLPEEPAPLALPKEFPANLSGMYYREKEEYGDLFDFKFLSDAEEGFLHAKLAERFHIKPVGAYPVKLSDSCVFLSEKGARVGLADVGMSIADGLRHTRKRVYGILFLQIGDDSKVLSAILNVKRNGKQIKM